MIPDYFKVQLLEYNGCLTTTADHYFVIYAAVSEKE